MTNPPETVAGDPMVGTTLDARYRLDGLIGRGGMASVYRGEDQALGRPVAVKVFTAAADGLDDDERRKSETALLASLSHRALVRLYDASVDAGTGREYLVMELVEGRDLREVLRLGPIGPDDGVVLLADLAEALHVIHDRGIVHRDVKPANVLLEPAHLPTRRWNPKLADFGIARLIDDARLTRTGLLVGTPGYLSPEQVSGAAPAPAADIYALGLLVLEARTGRSTFPGPAVEAVSARLIRDPEVPGELGADWVDLLRAMTAREPDDRPTAIEVAVAASALDTGPPVREATAATIAFADLADEPTQAAPGGAVGAVGAARAADAAGTGTPNRADAPAAADDPAEAPTLIAPLPPHPTDVSPDAGIDGTGRRASRGTPDRAPDRRRWLRPAIAAAVVAVIAVIVGTVLALSGTPQSAEPEPPLPSVPGELGVHLEELDEAVTG